jgi:hypothetical protein
MHKIKRLYFILIVISFSSSAKNIEEIVWISPIWDKYIGADGSGLYIDILDAVFPSKYYKITRQVAPWRRSILMIKNNRADITGGMLKTDSGLYATYPISLNEEGVFFRKNSIHHLEEINDLSDYFGVWYAGFFNDIYNNNLGLQGMAVNTREQAARLLLMDNRNVDYYFDEKELMFQTFRKIGLISFPKEFKYKKIRTSTLFMKFSNTNKGQKLRQLYDAGIKKLFCTNALKKIYAKWQIDLPPLEINCNFSKMVFK